MKKFRWKYWSVILICLFPAFELIVRVTGGSPFVNKEYKTEVTPENAYIGNDSLGIELNPGVYTVTVNDSVKFSATHTPNKRRVVLGNSEKSDSLSTVAMLGCSFTYGYGVNDGKEFSSIINKKYTNIKIENYAVIGYGTVQSLLQLQIILKDEPDLVVLNLSSFHLMRNVLNVKYRQSLKLGYARSRDEHTSMRFSKFPYVKDESLTIHHESWDKLYENWTGRETFAAINWLQNTIESYGMTNEENPELTYAIIEKMNELCLSRDIQFIVANIDQSDNTRVVQGLCETSNIVWFEQGFNFSNVELTNLPYDSHPNEKGHQYLAEGLSRIITSQLRLID